jgi:hypothetical protein
VVVVVFDYIRTALVLVPTTVLTVPASILFFVVIPGGTYVQYTAVLRYVYLVQVYVAELTIDIDNHGQ